MNWKASVLLIVAVVLGGIYVVRAIAPDPEAALEASARDAEPADDPAPAVETEVAAKPRVTAAKRDRKAPATAPEPVKLEAPPGLAERLVQRGMTEAVAVQADMPVSWHPGTNRAQTPPEAEPSWAHLAPPELRPETWTELVDKAVDDVEDEELSPELHDTNCDEMPCVSFVDIEPEYDDEDDIDLDELTPEQRAAREERIMASAEGYYERLKAQGLLAGAAAGTKDLVRFIRTEDGVRIAFGFMPVAGGAAAQLGTNVLESFEARVQGDED